MEGRKKKGKRKLKFILLPATLFVPTGFRFMKEYLLGRKEEGRKGACSE